MGLIKRGGERKEREIDGTTALWEGHFHLNVEVYHCIMGRPLAEVRPVAEYFLLIFFIF